MVMISIDINALKGKKLFLILSVLFSEFYLPFRASISIEKILPARQFNPYGFNLHFVKVLRTNLISIAMISIDILI
jgi:hypothetical protein